MKACPGKIYSGTEICIATSWGDFRQKSHYKSYQEILIVQLFIVRVRCSLHQFTCPWSAFAGSQYLEVVLYLMSQLS